MFTRNWYILQSLNMLAEEKQFSTHLHSLDWSGDENYLLYYYPLSRGINIYKALNTVKTDLTNNSKEGVLFGTGDTLASIDDYKLAGDLIQNIAVTVSRTYSYSKKKQSVKAVYTIANNNTEEITIKEVALNVGFPYDKNGNLNGCIIDRTVLDTPVTIPAGRAGQVEYTITFDLPTAP